MFTATRPARPNGAQPEGAPPAAGVDLDRSAVPEPDFDIDELVARHSLPLVVIDVARAARQYRALREAFPNVEVHYDVSALAHPALIAAVAESGGSFVAAHDGALAALTASQSDLRRVLHATSATHPHEVLAAYNAGVRRFVVDGPADVEKFASAPHDLALVVRLQPHTPPQAAHVAPRGVTARDAHRVVRDAAALGVRIAGFSLSTRPGASCSDYVAAIARTAGVMADVQAATGARFDVLDLGDGFPGRAARRPGERAELARAIRAIVAPRHLPGHRDGVSRARGDGRLHHDHRRDGRTRCRPVHRQRVHRRRGGGRGARRRRPAASTAASPLLPGGRHERTPHPP